MKKKMKKKNTHTNVMGAADAHFWFVCLFTVNARAAAAQVILKYIYISKGSLIQTSAE